MKKKIVDCSKPLGQQEIIVDIPENEKQKLLEASAIVEAKALEPKPQTLEERIAQLEAALAVR